MGLGEAFSDLQVRPCALAPPPNLYTPHSSYPSPFPSQSGGYTSTQVDIPDHVTVQEIQVTLGCGQTKSEHDIVVVYGIHDNLLTSIESPEATFCNNPWSQLFQRTGITEGDIWPPGSVSASSAAMNYDLCPSHFSLGLSCMLGYLWFPTLACKWV